MLGRSVRVFVFSRLPSSATVVRCHQITSQQHFDLNKDKHSAWKIFTAMDSPASFATSLPTSDFHEAFKRVTQKIPPAYKLVSLLSTSFIATTTVRNRAQSVESRNQQLKEPQYHCKWPNRCYGSFSQMLAGYKLVQGVNWIDRPAEHTTHRNA